MEIERPFRPDFGITWKYRILRFLSKNRNSALLSSFLWNHLFYMTPHKRDWLCASLCSPSFSPLSGYLRQMLTMEPPFGCLFFLIIQWDRIPTYSLNWSWTHNLPAMSFWALTPQALDTNFHRSNIIMLPKSKKRVRQLCSIYLCLEMYPHKITGLGLERWFTFKRTCCSWERSSFPHMEDYSSPGN